MKINNKSIPLTSVMLLLSVFLCVPMNANALTIKSGYDLFSTPAGGALLSLPDPTNPGSDIQVSFEGVSFGLGSTDTIVERKIPDPGLDLADGETSAPIDIELVALSLKSTTSLNFGAGDFDLYVSIMQTGGEIENLYRSAFGDKFVESIIGLNLLDSTGKMAITQDNNEGGTFDSCWGPDTAGGPCDVLGGSGSGIYAALIMTAVGDPTQVLGDPTDPTNPMNPQAWGPDVLWAQNTPWSPEPPAGYPTFKGFPSGDFYVAEISNHEGPHPTVVSAVPEPSTYLLFGAGLGFLSLARRNRNKKIKD